MANNAGRQAGGGGNNGQMNEHVEFTVKAEEDLYLTGSENTIRRVTAETNYSCLMLKSQRFSSLFRHYAKYHGLKKDDLEYYFVNPLENEDTPESVHLQRGDTIMVRKKRKPEPPEPASTDEEFFKDMRELLDDEEHMDVNFIVHTEGGGVTQIAAHKAILTARGDYFKALFRKGATTSDGVNSGVAFRSSNTINVDPCFTPEHVRHTLEFLYTNRIHKIKAVATDDLLSLLSLSDKWCLRDMKRLVEHELIRHHMAVGTVARMYCATEDFHAQRLAKACIEFIMANIRQVTANSAFTEEMKHYPHLCIPVLKAAAELIPEPVQKKPRTGEAATPAVAGVSSPVPDSDP